MYTTIQQVSFLVTIHDDSEVEPDEQFALYLTDATGGAYIGPSSMTIITIADDDTYKTSYALSFPASTGFTAVGTAGALTNVTIVAVRFDGKAQRLGGDLFMLTAEHIADDAVSYSFIVLCLFL